MTHVNTKGKAQAKRKESSRRSQWEKALMTVRKLKKSAEQGLNNATVVVGENMVVIRANQASEVSARLQKYLEHFGNLQERTAHALIESKSHAEQSNYRELINACKVHIKQVEPRDLVSAYNLYKQHEQVKDLVTNYNLHIEHERTRELVDAYHIQVAQAKHKDLIDAYYKQVRQHVENHQADRERFVRTLKESPTDEAMDFYRSIVN